MKLDAQIKYVDGRVKDGKPILTIAVNILTTLDRMREIKAELDGSTTPAVNIIGIMRGRKR